MPFHPGFLLSALLLVACLGVNAAHYPSVQRMLGKQSENESAAAFLPVQNVPPTRKPKTSNVNRPIPLEASPFPLAATPEPKPAPVKVPESKPEPPKPAEKKSEPPKSVEPVKMEKPADTPKAPEKPLAPPKTTEPEKAAEKKVVPSDPPPAKKVIKLESKPEPKPQPKLEAKTEAKPEPKPVAVPETSYAAFAPIVPESLQQEKIAPLSDLKEVPTLKEVPAPAYASRVEPLPKTDLQPLMPKKRPRPLPPEESIDMILERPVMYEAPPMPVVPAS